jgi:hypothetical protein
MNSSIVYLGRSSVPLLDACTYPKVLKVDENWVFPIDIYPNSDGRLETKPWEKYGRVSLVPEDIHNRHLYKLNKIRSNKAINEPMVTTDHCWARILTSLDP